MLEQDGTLHRGELSVNDLLDQVVILAYERFKDRPRKVSLDLWLTDLVQDALEQWIKQEPRPHVSLEERAEEFLPDEPPRDDDEEWWAELMGEEETLRLEDLIPDPEGTEPWTRPGGGGAERPAAGLDRQAAAGAAAGLPPARPGGLRHGRDRHAPGSARERGQGGHRSGPEVADGPAPGRGARRTTRTRAGRTHRPAKSRWSRPGDRAADLDSKKEEPPMADRRRSHPPLARHGSGDVSEDRACPRPSWRSRSRPGPDRSRGASAR